MLYLYRNKFFSTIAPAPTNPPTAPPTQPFTPLRKFKPSKLMKTCIKQSKMTLNLCQTNSITLLIKLKKF